MTTSPAGGIRRGAVALLAALLGIAGDGLAQIATAELQIQGSGLTLAETEVTTGIDIPTSVQTEFGGKRNDEAPFVPGLLVRAELTGPGLDHPLTLEAEPGRPIRIPALPLEGTYLLQNVRLVRDGAMLQFAVPSAATIVVADVLGTTLRVRQLTADELRARGIVLDGRNYDVYEYVFAIVLDDGSVVEIPFPVIVDPVTRELKPIARENPWTLPPDTEGPPPRWTPPSTTPFEFVEEGPPIPIPPPSSDPEAAITRPRIPAALVIPNDIAVLHQFFAAALVVTNGAPTGSQITLDSVSATIRTPPELRVSKTDPQVAFGQAVPIVDAASGLTLLVAQASGEAEWVLEGLRPGAHTIEFELRATYRVPGQPDVPLRATPKATVLVHDPRFNITFSHPDTVRQGIDYSAWTFVTNLSPATQTIAVSSGVPLCTAAPGANLCRAGSDADPAELTLAPGETGSLEHHFRPGVTGKAFATAGSIEGDAVAASVQLHHGVSEGGIPLSPATLILPHYARYLDPLVVSDQLPLLGLGYSLATAPLSPTTATLPRVIRTDVFSRGADLARAGQRIFLGEPEETALLHLALDLLGNDGELREWDELQRREAAGRRAMAALFQRLEHVSLAHASDIPRHLDGLASSGAHRAPFVAAIAHRSGGTAPTLTIRGASSGRMTAIGASEDEGWSRDLPFAELDGVSTRDGSASGSLALIGRVTEAVELLVTGPATVEVVFPSAIPGTVLRATLELAVAEDETAIVTVTAGTAVVEARSAEGALLASSTAHEVSAPPLAVVGTRQDLHLDPSGHLVSVLFNRPLASGHDLHGEFEGEVVFDRDGLSFRGPRPIAGAALQPHGRIVNLGFDHILSTNAGYLLHVGQLPDPLTGGPAAIDSETPIAVDNDRPAAILHGRVLQGGGAPIPGAEVVLSIISAASAPRAESTQYAITPADGSFLFEFVPRDVDGGYPGSYRLEASEPAGKRTSIEGAVRLPGRLHAIDLTFLGRGSAEGVVRYEDGTAVAGARVVIGSSMFGMSRSATSAADGSYRIRDLPVGPLTVSATDHAGRTAFAAVELRSAGELLVRDLVITRRDPSGSGTIRGVVLRSDDQAPVPGARVAAFSRSFAVGETWTGSDGRFELDRVPSGFATILAAEWSVSRHQAAQDIDLPADAVRELTMVLEVDDGVELVRIEGTVVAEDPIHPGDPAWNRSVANAIVRIDGLPAVVADGEGVFRMDGVPRSAEGRALRAWDPSSQRMGSTTLPPLQPGTNAASVFIPAGDRGSGTVRVKLLDAAGFPLDGARVFVPGFPTTPLAARGDGVYELVDVPVGHAPGIRVVASVPGYGHQTVAGAVRVSFGGQVASMTLRLPGQGRVRVSLRSDIDVIGDVKLTYPVWDDAAQSMGRLERTASTSVGGLPGAAEFDEVPALAPFTASADHPLHGHASATGSLAYEGDLSTHVLQLDRLAWISGTVYAIDGVTPAPGASIRATDGRIDRGTAVAGLDGRFTIAAVPAATRIEIVATTSDDGIVRTGRAGLKTPPDGGRVEGISIVLRRRGTVEGGVVHAGYRVFDPDDPSRNVVDDTPDDLSDNAPAPLARFRLRELDFPSREFGTAAEPLTADAEGRFEIPGVFEGPLRASARDGSNPDLNGDWSGELVDEGERVVAWIGIGGEGVGSIEATILDPNEGDEPVPSVEVVLMRRRFGASTPFDGGSTDGTGRVRFDQLPPGTYRIEAWSKTLGRSGTSGDVLLAANELAEPVILLAFSGKVRGIVTDPEAGGAGVSASNVTLTAPGWDTRTTADGAGSFLFDGVREGAFRLRARDTESNRIALGAGALSPLEPEPFVPLELERTESLHVAVTLPADDGSDSGVLAPPLELRVRQRCSATGCEVHRDLQGNPFVVPGLFRDGSYSVTARELGGEERTLKLTAAFPRGTAADPIRFLLPAFGTARVQVTQGGAPAGGARVTATGGGRSISAIADGSGAATLTGLPLGTVSVHAISLDGWLSGSTSGDLTSRTTPMNATIELGSFGGVTGLVEAEEGGPSVGTRVAAVFGGRTIETITGGDGRYVIRGIPVSGSATSVSLTFLGPDGTTVGAVAAASVPPGVAAPVEVPAVRLDATPPRLLSIAPADGAMGVAPDLSIVLVFSEALRPDSIHAETIQLIPAGGAKIPISITMTPLEGGRFAVTLVPPPGQPFPLPSHTLHRLFMSADLRDLAGHRMGTSRGSSFTTSDYAQPKIVAADPPTTQPLRPTSAVRFIWNEPLDGTAWSAGGGAQARLFRLAGPGGAIEEELPVRAFLDPAAPDRLHVAPEQPFAAEAHYRIAITGARDLQGNTASAATFDWASFDEVPPFVTLVSPILPEETLISGVEYMLAADIRNGGEGAPPAVDVDRVEYFRMNGETASFLGSVTAAPFGYRFVAPAAPEEGSVLTFRAIARDRSGNESPPASIQLVVKPNRAPQNLSLVFEPSSTFGGASADAIASFSDEGTRVTVEVTLQGLHRDGSTFQAAKSTVAQRPGGTWEPARLTFDIPPTLEGGSTVAATLRVTDVRGLEATASGSLTITADVNPPQLTIIEPASDQLFLEGSESTIPLRATAQDGETSVASVEASAGGSVVPLQRNGETWSGTMPVPLVDGSEDVPRSISFLARDWAGNEGTAEVEVRIRPLVDPNAPVVSWSCPTTAAPLPAGAPLRLRVHALGNGLGQPANGVQSVQFFAGSSPIGETTTSPGEDRYELAWSVPGDTPAGTLLELRALVTNVSGLTQSSITTIEVVGGAVLTGDLTIDESNAAAWAGQDISLAAGTATIAVPLSVRRLIVLDGARVVPPPGGTLELTAEEIYVSCMGALDASGRGLPQDTSIGGEISALHRAGGSHLGEGGTDSAAGGYSAPGTTFGSVRRPREPGGGGGGPGAPGGGVLVIGAGEIHVDGSIAADGAGQTAGGGGAGGSIDLVAEMLAGRGLISASGGASSRTAGGGGAIVLRVLDDTRWRGRVRSAGAKTILGESAAGTIHRVSVEGEGGDLLIDGGERTTAQRTVLPGFGHARAASVQGADVTLDSITWVAPWLMGRLVEVRAPDGTLRGRWPIEAVEQSAIVLPNTGVVGTDGLAYEGYLVYSAVPLGERFGSSVEYHHDKNLFAARWQNGVWGYDRNSGFLPFEPRSDDRIVAWFSKPSAIGEVRLSRCASSGCGSIGGIQVAELARGRVLANSETNGVPNSSEFLVLGGVVMETAPVIRLGAIGGVDPVVLAGDALRGVQSFDSITLGGTALSSVDLLEAEQWEIDALSSFAASNGEAPTLRSDRVSIASSTAGWWLAGSAGAAFDVDLPMRVHAMNRRTFARFVASVQPDGSFAVALEGEAGDAIVAWVEDGHALPLRSAVVEAGALTVSQLPPPRVDQEGWAVDSAFRARSLARDGSVLAVASLLADETGSSSRVAFLALESPEAPAWIRTVTLIGTVRDLEGRDGRMFVAANAIWSVNLADPASPPVRASGDGCGVDFALALSGSDLFSAEAGCAGVDRGRINVYDVSDPAAPRFLRVDDGTRIVGHRITDMLALGDEWLVAVGSTPANGDRNDVVVLDRRDPNALVVAADLEIPAFAGFRASLDGSTLWIVSRASSELVAVDLSNPRAPQVVGRTFAGVAPGGVAAGGGYVVVAGGASGVLAFDQQDLSPSGARSVDGVGWDALLYQGIVYAADDGGLSLFPVDIGPMIDARQVTVERTAEAVATISGAPRAVSPAQGVTMELNGAGAGTPDEDGSFSISVGASPGDPLSLTALDAMGRASTPVPLAVPFASSIEVRPATPALALGQAAYRARRVAANGEVALAATGSLAGTSLGITDVALLFSLPAASAPTPLAVDTGNGGIRDVALLGARAWAAGDRLTGWSVTAEPPAPGYAAINPCGYEQAIAVTETHAFTAAGSCTLDGRIYTWSIGSPPFTQIGSASTVPQGGFAYTALLIADSQLLLGVSPDSVGGAGRDLTVIDRTNPAALAVLGTVDVPGFAAVGGTVEGATVYLVGLDGGVAIVDISSPSSPLHVATIDTPGIARGVVVSGPGEIAVADGALGLTFIDVADRTTPVVLGSQPLAGNAVDVTRVGSSLIVATEHHVQIVNRP